MVSFKVTTKKEEQWVQYYAHTRSVHAQLDFNGQLREKKGNHRDAALAIRYSRRFRRFPTVAEEAYILACAGLW